MPPDAPAKGTGRYVAGWVVLGLDLLIVVGMFALALYDGIRSLMGKATLAAGVDEFSTWSLQVSAIASLLVFAAGPVAWTMLTRVRPWEGTKLYLRLERPGRGIAIGVGLGLAVLLVSGLLSAAIDALAPSLTDNPVVDKLLDGLDVPTAILVAIGAGVGEEIFFRGLLQKRLGIVLTSLIFGLVHASYGTVLQVVVPFLMAFAFAGMRHRWGLWCAIAAHTTYDLVALLLGMAFKDLR